ncbi:MAG: alanine racemase, partial [Bacteroidia bacterium]|nr:alanine racemase [Bacteroidia bacterium]
MAFVTLDTKKLAHNYTYLNHLFKQQGIDWAVVTKLLCGNKIYLDEVLKLGVKQVCDSRIMNLKTVKSLNPSIETIYIKPPAKNNAANVVKYADFSVNSESGVIQRLSDEAVKQNKIHKVIIMVELGELREGIMGEHLIEFYKKIFNMKNIEVAGIGANLSCLYGILPSQDKLIQLSLYEQLIEAKFERKIQYVSGGSSVTIPLLLQGVLPRGINHFRVGETLFFGTNVYDSTELEGLEHDVFNLYVNIIEITEKPMVPSGSFGTNLEGDIFSPDTSLLGKTSKRALIDIGLLDVDKSHMRFVDPDLEIVGATSDIIVVDLGKNEKEYKAGDLLPVKLDYMATLKLLNSKYVEKRVV